MFAKIKKLLGGSKSESAQKSGCCGAHAQRMEKNESCCGASKAEAAEKPQGGGCCGGHGHHHGHHHQH